MLFRGLYEVGLASQPTATSADDGMELFGVRMVAPVHCAPPQNKPTTTERDNCAKWFRAELELLFPTARSVVVLGGFGWQVALRELGEFGWEVPRPRPKFGHGVQVCLHRGDETITLFGCYHVSQHNTFTGRLTPAMLGEVLAAAADHAGIDRRTP